MRKGRGRGRAAPHGGNAALSTGTGEASPEGRQSPGGGGQRSFGPASWLERTDPGFGQLVPPRGRGAATPAGGVGLPHPRPPTAYKCLPQAAKAGTARPSRTPPTPKPPGAPTVFDAPTPPPEPSPTPDAARRDARAAHLIVAAGAGARGRGRGAGR